MAGGPLTWRAATLVERWSETESGRGLAFDVPSWPGHLAGQHVDVRLTAEDGYSTERSYSISNAAGGERVELTVQRVPDGEVSPYLADGLTVGEQVELRGPVGGWFVWRPAVAAPVFLAAGGSGIAPLMAMIRARRQAGSTVPFRLLYSVRDPADVYYAKELEAEDVRFVYTRRTPDGWPTPPGRVSAADVTAGGWPVDREPECFVCGPTGFVEAVADVLVTLGHDPRRIRTERFGPTGG
jgi:ferredoxin-NADP reductase